MLRSTDLHYNYLFLNYTKGNIDFIVPYLRVDEFKLR